MYTNNNSSGLSHLYWSTYVYITYTNESAGLSVVLSVHVKVIYEKYCLRPFQKRKVCMDFNVISGNTCMAMSVQTCLYDPFIGT